MDPLDTILEAISGGGGKPSAAEPAAEASPKGPALPIGSLKRRQAVLQVTVSTLMIWRFLEFINLVSAVFHRRWQPPEGVKTPCGL